MFATTSYTHPALEANEDGNYRVRLVGQSQEVTLTKAAKLSASITLNDNATVAIPYTEEGTVDYEALRQNLLTALVASSTPDLSLENVTIEYNAKATSGSLGDLGKNWAPLEGGKVAGLTYPAIEAGAHTIRISYAGDERYGSTSAQTEVTLTDRGEAPYVRKDTPDQIVLSVDENLNVDYDAAREAVYNAVIESSEVLSPDNVTITYYAEATSGSLGELGHAWVPLEGGTSGGLTYPGMAAGTRQVRIYWPGNREYAPTTVEATVNVADREQLQFALKEGPYEVGMVFNAEQGYDFEATAAAIYNAVVPLPLR